MLLDPNPCPPLLQLFETVVLHEGFIAKQRINIGSKQSTDKTNDESEIRIRQKQRIVAPEDFLGVKQHH